MKVELGRIAVVIDGVSVFEGGSEHRPKIRVHGVLVRFSRRDSGKHPQKRDDDHRRHPARSVCVPCGDLAHGVKHCVSFV